MDQLRAVFGLVVLLGICWLASNNRKAISWRIVAWGIGLQIAFGLMILKTAPGYWVFNLLSDIVNRLISFTDYGSKFVWGSLYKNNSLGLVFFTDVLMTIVFFSALMSLLYHLGVMQRIMVGIARVMQKTMRTSGSETLSASANIFVGQTEAPLVVKPFIDKMTLSELHAVMVGGFATVAGGVLAAYISFGIDAGHLLAASVMSAPAALVCAKMFFPETEQSETAGAVKIELEQTSANVFDAVCTGAADGMKLVLNVAAMLLAFVCIIYGMDWCISELHRWIQPGVKQPFTLSMIIGWLFAPVAWILGVPWGDCKEVGQLLGAKMVINEFVAYLKLQQVDLSPRAYVLATYAFCGFANFSSIAIQIGGISTIAPSRRQDLARLGLRAMLAGTIAAFLTANIAGALLTNEQMERDYRKNKARVAETYAGALDQLDAFINKYPDSSYKPEFRELRLKNLDTRMETLDTLEPKLEMFDLFLARYPDDPMAEKVRKRRAEVVKQYAPKTGLAPPGASR